MGIAECIMAANNCGVPSTAAGGGDVEKNAANVRSCIP